MPARPGPTVRPIAPRRGWRLAACAALALALGMPAVRAERADRYKPTNVESDRMHYDDLKQVNVFTGAVVLTKGTITIRGDRMVLRQDPEGYQYGTTTGRLASFRQKRDGVDEWIEGHAEEIHYDGKAETVRLTGRAKVRRLEGVRPGDEIEGAVIVYDSRTEQFSVDGSGQASGPAGPGGRVKVVIQPRLGDASATGPSGAGAGTPRPGADAASQRPPSGALRPAEPR
jgi:lipopolysaccharide export system protein LptA